MHWRSGTEASTRFPGLRALAGPVCGALLLLAGGRASAQATAWPPAWVPPRSNNYYYETSWRRQALAEMAPPSSLLAPPGRPLSARAVPAGPADDGPALEPIPEPTTIIRCAALGGPALDDDMPVFPIQFRFRDRGTGMGAAGFGADTEAGEEGMPQFLIQLQPPGPERLFKLESEANFQERIRQQTPRRPYEPVVFPDEPVLSTSKEPPQRAWPPQRERVEPYYVCYGPLLYQQKYAERYGWDLGAIAPFVSLGTFWFDVLTAPYHLAVGPCLAEECNTGYCLPGDPTPLRLDPPQWPVVLEVNYYGSGRGAPAGGDSCGCGSH